MGPRSLLRRLNREERGQTILVFALMFVALLGFTAVVSDAGIVYWNRRILQNAVDAAALAGANKLPSDTNAAIQAAVTYAQDNGVAPSELVCQPSPPNPYPASVTCQSGQDATFGLQVTKTYSDNDTMLVSARRHVNFGLRYIIGAGDTDVVATASAIVAVQNPGNIAPMAISLKQINTAASDGTTPVPCNSPYTECSLKVGGGDCSKGNCQLINWDKATPGAGGCPGGGNTCVDYSMTYGYPGPIATPVATAVQPDGTTTLVWNWDVPTEPGNKANIDKVVTQFLQWDATKECDGGQSCPGLYATPDPSVVGGANFYPDAPNGVVCYQYVECPRVVVVPFISQAFTDANGQTMVTIVNFGCFYITRTQGSGGSEELDGMFIPTCKSTTGDAEYGIPLTSGGIIGNDIGVYIWR